MENARRQTELALQAMRLLGFRLDKRAWDEEEADVSDVQGARSGKRAPEEWGSGVVVADLGCGSGLSTAAVRGASKHATPDGRPLAVVGCDIAGDMVLEAARRLGGRRGRLRPAVGLLRSDFSQGLPFRDSAFSHAVSVSAIQWLATERERESFFASLWRVLASGGRAALQFYPSGPQDAENMLQTALKGESHCFAGGLVMDMPHSAPQRKWYLCLRKVECVACKGGLCGSNGCTDRTATRAVASLPQCELAFPYRASCALSWRQHVTANGQGECQDVTALTVALARAKKRSSYYQLHRQHLQRSHALVRLHTALQETPPPRKQQRTEEASGGQRVESSKRSAGRRRRRAGSSKSLTNDISPEDATALDIRLARTLAEAAGEAANFAQLQRVFPAVLEALHSVEAPKCH